MLGGMAVVALAACGSTSEAGGRGGAAEPQLVSLFSSDRVIAAGIEQRIPFAVVDAADLELPETVELPVRILAGGAEIATTSVVGRLVDHDHPGDDDPDHQHADLLRYFALRAELPEPGIFDIEVDFGAGAIGRLPVQAFDPAEIAVPLVGQPLPPITTPTITDPDGISPLCTRPSEPCEFHRLDVASAVGNGRPLALLVATPAFCSTAYCGPVLETLIAAAPGHPGIDFVHLEVYANADDVDGGYSDPDLELAAPVTELGLTFEPSLFLVDSGGIVADRIDNVYGRPEVDEALAALR